MRVMRQLRHLKTSFPTFRLAGFDPFIIVPVIVLASLSLLILFSINLPPAGRSLDFNPYQQLGFVIGGLVLMGGLSRLDYRLFKKWALYAYIVALVLLIIVSFYGDAAGGAQRWLSLGDVRFQPAELAKASLILLLARIFSQATAPGDWRPFLKSGLYAAIIAILIATQPDLSSAIICAAVWFAVALGARVPKRMLVLTGIASVSLVLAGLPLLADYQRERLTDFLNPASQDPLGSGYNSQQALITVGSGGMWGQGLSGGSQSQLLFLPEQHTDFIFAVVAEKLGFAGVVILLAAYSTLVFRLFSLVGWTRDRFGSYVLMGVSGLLAIQIVVNIAMNIGLLPVTGLPLPFLSYGGTHTLISYGLLGVALSIVHHERQLTYKKARTRL